MAGVNLDLALPGKLYADFNFREKTTGEFKTEVMFGGGVRIGYAFGALGQQGRVAPRFELALDYNRGNMKGEFQDIKVSDITKDCYLGDWSLMANAIFDFELGSKFYPYVGVGLGLNYMRPNIELDFYDDDKGEQVTADISGTIYLPQVQFIIGGGYNITEKIGLYAECRLNARFGASVDVKDFIDANALMRPGIVFAGGARFSF